MLCVLKRRRIKSEGYFDVSVFWIGWRGLVLGDIREDYSFDLRFYFIEYRFYNF